MADDLKLELRAIAGEGPSPEFVASLRERVLAEAAAPRATMSDGEIVAVEPRPLEQEERSMTKNRWMLTGAAAAAVTALIVGLVVVADGGGDTTPIDEPTTVTTSEAPTTAPRATTAPTTTTTSTTVPTTEAERDFDFDNDIEVLETAFFLNVGDSWEGVILVNNLADYAVTLEARMELLNADGIPLDSELAESTILPGETTAFTTIFGDVPATQEPTEIRLIDEFSSAAEVSGAFTLSDVQIGTSAGAATDVTVLFTNDTDVDLEWISAVFVARGADGSIIVAREEREPGLASGDTARIGAQLFNVAGATVEAYPKAIPAG